MEVGDYVIARKLPPEMGSVGGLGWSIAKITNKGPREKFLIRELPTRRSPAKLFGSGRLMTWTLTILSSEPDSNSLGLVISQTGFWTGHGRSRIYYKLDEKLPIEGREFEEFFSGGTREP